MTKNRFQKILKILLIVFIAWVLLLIVVFFAMKFGFTKTGGVIDDQSAYFAGLYKDSQSTGDGQRKDVAEKGWNDIQQIQEWIVVKNGILKDKEIISNVSQKTGVPERLLIAPLVVEQLRLMTSEREYFKKFFQPLSILGAQTQFSLGIYGIKEKTARDIENNLKDNTSPYYLGPEYEHMLDYDNSTTTILVDSNSFEIIKKPINPTKNTNSSSSNITASTSSTTISTTTDATTSTLLLTGSDAERIMRLTDKKDHTYSYLYAALYIKEILTAWKKAGYDISDRPEIVATVYNLGFPKSNPNPNPQVGGAEIQLNGQKYSFGSIAFYFYFSNEMQDVFNK
ncbi:MAG: hypothetical protein WCO35_03850 [Candidatus Nomurabacteria bacterium]